MSSPTRPQYFHIHPSFLNISPLSPPLSLSLSLQSHITTLIPFKNYNSTSQGLNLIPLSLICKDLIELRLKENA